VSFSLRAGEIVGMAGLMGSGRTELAETIFGIRSRLDGDITLSGRPLHIRHARDAIASGIFLIPEDRRLHGLVLPMSVKDNISLASLHRVSRLSLVVPQRERELATTMCSRLNIRTAGFNKLAGLLSGGNQQKVVLAKWLSRTARVLILDEPTRGIDVGAKSEIYALMDRLAKDGLAILMISSDLEEILGMSDRVLVMHEGSLAGELSRSELSEERIMHMATGGARHQMTGST
jgi:ribose transport system ATP-binding protein